MKRDFITVGLGASAGGLPALVDFFKCISPLGNIAFVIVLHLMRDYRSNLDIILARFAPFPVIRVDKNMVIEPGKVYVIVENTYLTIENGIFKIEPRNDKKQNFAVDIFFKSLAQDFKEKAVGIIFSGGGSDGLEGSKAINDKGGNVMVQDPASAQVDGMPVSIIRHDHPKIIMEPKDLAKYMEDLYWKII